MSDITFLLPEVERLRAADQTFAIGTVVRISGSTYRQAGGRMLVREDLSTWGLISGGCLEEEIAREAESVLQTGQPVLRSYDMTGPDDRLGFNTGCNGAVDVLITRGSPALAHLKTSMAQRETGVLIQTVSGPDEPGSATWIGTQELHKLNNDEVLLTHVKETVQSKQSTYLQEHDRALLIEYLQPPIRAVVFGTGADAKPLVLICSALGWEVTLVGRRSQSWLREHFPRARQHVFLMHPESALDHLASDDRTAAVVMNHNVDRDRTLTRELLRSSIPYVGLLGPRARCREIAEAAMANGVASVALDRLYGPAGLDTGAETPEEIAMSIVAEILSVLNGRPASHLRDGSGPIHASALRASVSQ